MIPPSDEVITRDALDRVQNSSTSDLRAVERRLEEKIAHELALLRAELKEETKLRELTERLGGEALKKASDFITEKTEEHNNLLSEMRLDRTNFVTKPELEKEKESQHKTIKFYISVAAFILLIIQTVWDNIKPMRQESPPAPVTISQPENAPVPVKEIP